MANNLPGKPAVYDWQRMAEAAKTKAANILHDKKQVVANMTEVAAGYGGEALGGALAVNTRNMVQYKGMVRGGSIVGGVLVDGLAKFMGHHKVSRAAFGFQSVMTGAELERMYREKDEKLLAEGKGPLVEVNKKKAELEEKNASSHTPASAPSQPSTPVPADKPFAQAHQPATKGQQLMDAQGRVVGEYDPNTGAFNRIGPGNRGFGSGPGVGVDPIYGAGDPLDGADAPDSGAVPYGNRGVGAAPVLFRSPGTRVAIYRALRRRGVPHPHAAAGADAIAAEADMGAYALDAAGDDPDTSGDPEVEGVVDEAVSLYRMIAKQAARQAKMADPKDEATAGADEQLLALAGGIVIPIDRDSTGAVHYTGGDGDFIDEAAVGANLEALCERLSAGDVTGARGMVRARHQARPRKRALRKAARYQQQAAKRALAEQQARRLELEAQKKAQTQYAAQAQYASQLQAQNDAMEAELANAAPDTTYWDASAYEGEEAAQAEEYVY